MDLRSVPLLGSQDLSQLVAGVSGGQFESRCFGFCSKSIVDDILTRLHEIVVEYSDFKDYLFWLMAFDECRDIFFVHFVFIWKGVSIHGLRFIGVSVLLSVFVCLLNK